LPFPINTSLLSPMAGTKFPFLPKVLIRDKSPSRDKKHHGRSVVARTALLT
jgi:hypothetical protein